MKALTVTAALILAAVFTFPWFAGTSSVNLPHLTFPDPVITPSTKGCGEAATVEVCQPEE